MLLFSVATAFALDEPRVWVGAAIGGSVGAAALPGEPDQVPGGGGVGGVEAGVRLGKPRTSIALAARVHEAVVAEPLRTVGNIEVQVQYPAGTGPYALVGFSHNHEALADAWLAEPVGVTAGVAASITHRTGFEVGGGWMLDAPYQETVFLARFRPTFALAAHVFPDPGGPLVYGVLEVGLRIQVDPG